MSINAIGDTENDRVAFIALHGFKILYKERLVSVGLEKVFFFRCALPPLGKQLVDQFLFCRLILPEY